MVLDEEEHLLAELDDLALDHHKVVGASLQASAYILNSVNDFYVRQAAGAVADEHEAHDFPHRVSAVALISAALKYG